MRADSRSLRRSPGGTAKSGWSLSSHGMRRSMDSASRCAKLPTSAWPGSRSPKPMEPLMSFSDGKTQAMR